MKPRLLIILNRLVVGGQSIDTVPLANALSDQYDVLIVYGEREKDEMEFSHLIQSSRAITFKKLPSLMRSVNPLNDIVAINSLYRIIKKFKPQIVHTHGTKPGVNGRLAASLAKVPVIIHTFHGHLFHSYYNRTVSSAIVRLEKFLGSLSSKIVVLSEQQRKEICEEYRIVKQEKVQVISLGVDENFYSENAESLRKNFRNEYHLSENCVAIGIIGRIVPVKNHKLFAEIIIRLMQLPIKDKVKFFIVGDGYSKKEIQDILTRAEVKWSDNKNNEKAKVVFTSWVTPITQVLHGLDVVALTSLNEGTPLSLIEAQICAKPVVATDVGGVKDTFINNESGFLIEHQNASEFINKLTLLIENYELRKKMGCAGKIFAKKKFSKQAEVNAFKELYANCITSVMNK